MNIKASFRQQHLASSRPVDPDAYEAFAWLEKAYELRDPQLTYLKVGPKFTPLRSDPRFQGLLRRMGPP